MGGVRARYIDAKVGTAKAGRVRARPARSGWRAVRDDARRRWHILCAVELLDSPFAVAHVARHSLDQKYLRPLRGTREEPPNSRRVRPRALVRETSAQNNKPRRLAERRAGCLSRARLRARASVVSDIAAPDAPERRERYGRAKPSESQENPARISASAAARAAARRPLKRCCAALRRSSAGTSQRPAPSS